MSERKIDLEKYDDWELGEPVYIGGLRIETISQGIGVIHEVGRLLGKMSGAESRAMTDLLERYASLKGEMSEEERDDVMARILSLGGASGRHYALIEAL